MWLATAGWQQPGGRASSLTNRAPRGRAGHHATRLVCPARQSHLGWQPSRSLTDRAKAERAFALAEQLGSVNAAAQALGTTWPSLRKASATRCAPSGISLPWISSSAARPFSRARLAPTTATRPADSTMSASGETWVQLTLIGVLGPPAL